MSKYIKYTTNYLYILIVSFAITGTIGSAKAEKSTKKILGWVERVELLPMKLKLHAKLDTGADYSSLGVRNLKEFERNGDKWVSFKVRNRYDDEVKIERPVVRTATIKGHWKNSKRNVIRLGICIGNLYMEEEVNLVNRTKYEYQMLVGRSFLTGKAYIDPSSIYKTKPSCEKAYVTNSENESSEEIL